MIALAQRGLQSSSISITDLAIEHARRASAALPDAATGGNINPVPFRDREQRIGGGTRIFSTGLRNTTAHGDESREADATSVIVNRSCTICSAEHLNDNRISFTLVLEGRARKERTFDTELWPELDFDSARSRDHEGRAICGPGCSRSQAAESRQPLLKVLRSSSKIMSAQCGLHRQYDSVSGGGFFDVSQDRNEGLSRCLRRTERSTVSASWNRIARMARVLPRQAFYASLLRRKKRALLLDGNLDISGTER